MDADTDLAVANLAQGAGVLPGQPGRGTAVLRESGVVHHPHLRPHRCHRPSCQPGPDVPDRPGRGRHELLQLLMIDPEPFGHRLHRLPPTLQQQSVQIADTGRPLTLVLPRQRCEYLESELLQQTPHRSKFPSLHPASELPDTHCPARRAGATPLRRAGPPAPDLCGRPAEPAQRGKRPPPFQLVEHGCGTARRPCTLVFATLAKPDIRFTGALDDDIEVPSVPTRCSLCGRPVGKEGLLWRGAPVGRGLVIRCGLRGRSSSRAVGECLPPRPPKADVRPGRVPRSAVRLSDDQLRLLEVTTGVSAARCRDQGSPSHRNPELLGCPLRRSTPPSA